MEDAEDAKDPARLPESRVPRPDFDAVAPSDWLGHRAVRVMLEDLQFPATAGGLRKRAGNWRVPARNANDKIPLRELLDAFDENERFRSAEDAARRIARRHHGF